MSQEPTGLKSTAGRSRRAAEAAWHRRPWDSAAGPRVSEYTACGRTVLHYEVLEKLGQGGMGVVYKARDLRLGRLVALKFPRPGWETDAGALERFQREARALSALNHPNIATIHGLCEAHGELFLVMEFLPGRSLKALIRALNAGGLRLPVDAIREYAAGIGSALAHAHRQGIIHRDVKSGNVLFTSLGVPKLTDFGLARLLEGATVTREGALVGTLSSMAPEQARGEAADRRSDIFSFGVLLYEMASGRLPFQGSSSAEVLSALLYREPADLRSIRPDLPETFVRVVEKALVKDRERRYQDMEELLADLGSPGAQGAPVVAQRPEGDELAPTVTIALPPVAKSRPKLRMGAVAAIAALALGLASHSGVPVGRNRNHEPRSANGYETGRRLLARHDVPENVERAVQVFQAALRKNARDTMAEAALAEAYWRKYELTRDPAWIEKAGQSCRRLLASGASVPEVHVIQGLIRSGTGRPADALQDFERALARDPVNADACLGMGQAFEQLGRRGDAEQSYLRAAQFRPEDWRAHNALGRLYWAQARYADAETQFRKVIRLAPDSVRGYSNLGGLLVQVGRYEEAARQLERSLSLRATPSAHSNLGTAYYFQGRYADAAAQMEKAVALQPREARLWGNLADAYRMLPGRREDAARAYRRAVELAAERLAVQPQDTRLRASLAVYWAGLAGCRRALEEIRTASREASDDPGVQFRSALVFELCGRRREAACALAKARRSGYSLEEIARHPDLARVRERVKSGAGLCNGN